MATWRGTGAELYQPYFLALLAETYGTEGRTEPGRALVTEGLTAIAKSGERWWEAVFPSNGR